MEAKELRIGNWVQRPNYIKPHKVGKSDYSGYTMAFYTPILLTDGWLVRLGFKALGLIGEHFIFHAKAEKKMSCGQFEIWRSESGNHYNIIGGFDNDFKHVHQIQNAYFALTGKELTINE